MGIGRHVPVVLALFAATLAQADPPPIIATYELRKERLDGITEARNPRRFWIKQIVAGIEHQIAASPLRLTAPVTVVLGFTVARDGRLVSKAVETTSGVVAADRAATRMLERAQPFQPMPASMSDAQLSFTLPVRFK